MHDLHGRFEGGRGSIGRRRQGHRRFTANRESPLLINRLYNIAAKTHLGRLRSKMQVTFPPPLDHPYSSLAPLDLVVPVSADLSKGKPSLVPIPLMWFLPQNLHGPKASGLLIISTIQSTSIVFPSFTPTHPLLFRTPRGFQPNPPQITWLVPTEPSQCFSRPSHSLLRLPSDVIRLAPWTLRPCTSFTDANYRRIPSCKLGTIVDFGPSHPVPGFEEFPPMTQ